MYITFSNTDPLSANLLYKRARVSISVPLVPLSRLCMYKLLFHLITNLECSWALTETKGAVLWYHYMNVHIYHSLFLLEKG